LSGRGSEIIDSDGRRYLDASGGAAVSCIGHCDARVTEAIYRQVSRLDYVHSGAFTSEPAEELADLLCAATPLSLEKVYFVSSGSEAVETAIKMARQCQSERGQTGRHHLISRRQSYHGNTLGALARSGSEARRQPYLPMMVDPPRIDPCFAYHYMQADETPEAYGLRAATALEEKIQHLGAGTVAAFIAETVIGATSGAVVPPPGYFRAIRDICDRHGVLLILDEVMCGTNRTGPFLACEDEGITPDIVTLAKGLGGGYLPIGAVMCTASVHDTFSNGSGRFVHGHTYMAHPVACAAAVAVQRVIEEDFLSDNVRLQGKRLDGLLRHSLGNHPHVGDIRGKGLLQAIEFVSSREDRLPFPTDRGLAAAVGAACRDEGLLVYPGSGTVDGTKGDHILLAPPYNVTMDELVDIVERVTAAITSTVSAR
jgi:adenosylmethionine-8-amino-7-oxononanoate aminotransferase